MTIAREKLKGWLYIGPGLLWTLAFFVVPLLIMAAYSLFQRVGGRIVTDLSLGNYIAFFSKFHQIEVLLNSLEVTLITTVISIILAYPLALYSCVSHTAQMAAPRSDDGDIAFLDILCRPVLQLAAGFFEQRFY